MNLVGLAFEKSFRVDGSHAARARGSDRLAIHVILHVTARENSRNACLRAVVSYDVAGRV